MKLTLLMFHFFLVVGCSKPTEPMIDERDIVREVIFRSFTQHAGSDTFSKYYFLAISAVDSNNRFVSHADPSKYLLERFRDVPIPVRPHSEMILGDGDAVKHKDTGENGYLFRVGQISESSQNTIELIAGSKCGGRCADTFRFFMTKRNGLWVIDSTKWLWSS